VLVGLGRQKLPLRRWGLLQVHCGIVGVHSSVLPNAVPARNMLHFAAAKGTAGAGLKQGEDSKRVRRHAPGPAPALIIPGQGAHSGTISRKFHVAERLCSLCEVDLTSAKCSYLSEPRRVRRLIHKREISNACDL
jgi:hypothetical protein